MKMYYKDIFEAINYNDVEAVKTFLPDCLEIKDEYNGTPLHCAFITGRTEIVQLLLDNKANIEAKDEYGWTPLHYACRAGNIEMVILLLSNGADINARSNDGSTPLHISCSYGKHQISELLVSFGAAPTVLDNNGLSALDRDTRPVRNNQTEEGKSECKISHRDILVRLREEYLNKQAADATEHTAPLASEPLASDSKHEL